MNKTEVIALLNSEAKTEEVEKDIQEAQELRIHGVPFFVIDRKYGISGAQPIEIFIETLTKAYQGSKPKFEMPGTKNDDICEDGNCRI